MTAITTPLRYPGGKARALKEILPRLPEIFSEYREPFLGGGSVFIALKQQFPNIVFKINDLNTDVFYFWKTLQENPKDLVQAIKNIRINFNDGKSLYQKLSKSTVSSQFARALRFYTLNRITYSGIADSGGYSQESYEKRFTRRRINLLSELSEILRNVLITNESYEKLLFESGEEVFIFLDPPYWNARNFPLYGKKGDMNKFFDHKLFAEDLKKCKHKWLITCDDTEYIRNLFSFARHIEHWEMKYNGMNKKQSINGKELFITNYEKAMTY